MHNSPVGGQAAPFELVGPESASNASIFSFPGVGQIVQTNIDIEDRILRAIALEGEQDGAEGHPLSFDMSSLSASLTASTPSSSTPSSSTPSLSTLSSSSPSSPSLSSSSPSSSKAPTSKRSASTQSTSKPSPSTPASSTPSSSPPSLVAPPSSSLLPFTSSSPSVLSSPLPTPRPGLRPTASSSVSTDPTASRTGGSTAAALSSSSGGAVDSTPHTASVVCLPRKPHPDGIQKAPNKSKSNYKKLQSKVKNIRKRRLRAIEAENSRMPNFFRKPPLSTHQHLSPPDILKVDLDCQTLPVATHCWVGQKLKPKQMLDPKRTVERNMPWTLEELLERGFRVVDWDGRSTKIISDKKDRAIVVFVGPPLSTSDRDWEKVTQSAAETMASVREDGYAKDALPHAFQHHRRGDFVALAVGVSFGGGQKAPGTLVHSLERQKLINRLLADTSIQRLMGYQSSSLSYYSPKHYAHYCRRLLHVYENDRSLKRNYAESIFPAVSFNLGPASVSVEHTDDGNVGYGLCALVSLGNFDPQRGGHLVLFDLGLIVPFPPGRVALLPSAILRHGNTPIQPHEERYSIAQYCAGGLLRWHEYGFRTTGTATKGKGKAASRQIITALNGNHDDRVRDALALFSEVGALDTDRRSVFTNFREFLIRPLADASSDGVVGA